MSTHLFIGGLKDGQRFTLDSILHRAPKEGEPPPEVVKFYYPPRMEAPLSAMPDATMGVTVKIEVYLLRYLRGRFDDPGHFLYCLEGLEWVDIFNKLVVAYKP